MKTCLRRTVTYALTRSLVVLSFTFCIPHCPAQIAGAPSSSRSSDAGTAAGGSSGQSAKVSDGEISPAVMKELEALKARIEQLEAELRKSRENSQVATSTTTVPRSSALQP